jgi:hypothetical protein
MEIEMKDEDYELTLEKAGREYLSRKNRDSHPAGSFDNAKRWEPDSTEWCSCCASIRSPSRAFPFSLMTHCRSLQHVANLFFVDAHDLREKLKQMK